MNRIASLRGVATHFSICHDGLLAGRKIYLRPFRALSSLPQDVSSNTASHINCPRISPSIQHRFVSTDPTSNTNSDDNTLPDLSSMSHRELEQLALTYVRQANPMQAQRVLEFLMEPTMAADKASIEQLAILRTSVMDAWLEYQSQQMEQLRTSVQHVDEDEHFLSTLRDQVRALCHAAKSASELVEHEWQHCDDETGGTNVSQQHPILLAVLRAWANTCEATHLAGLTSSKSSDWSGIPQRSQYLFITFQEKAASNKSLSIELANQVLKAWAYSGEHLRGTMAENFLQTIDTTSMNGETFRYIIRAWSWSKEKRCAFTATGHWMRMMRLLEAGQKDMEPTLEDYHALFQAWTTAEDKNAPSKVQTVLQLADNAYRKGHTKVRPDLECYTYALQTMARRVNVPDVGELVDQTLLEMKKERMIIPNTACYGSAILAWKHVALGRVCDDREGAIQRTYDLLQEMIGAFHRTTLVTIRPTTENYNHVLEALTMSKASKATLKVEALLKALEKAADQTLLGTETADETGQRASEKTPETRMGLAPNADSYKYALMVCRNSKSSLKTEYAKELLARLTARVDQLRATSTEHSLIEAMSMSISVCAKDTSKDSSHKMELMSTALRTLEGMRKLGLAPNSTTYSALLEACDALVDSGQDRQRILENIFVRACKEGHVDQSVLEHFKAAASTYLYAKLVVAPSQEVENMKVVPESWTRNVQGFSANSKGGRKVLPLTIEGQFTFTKAAAEYKMRKLRKQANKHMLQGGRMR